MASHGSGSFKNLAVESARVGTCSEYHGSGRVGSGRVGSGRVRRFQLSWVGSLFALTRKK